MTSNDNSITLTTHRVLQKTAEVNKEIFLKDIVSHEIIRKRHKYFQILTFLFGIPTVFIYALYFSEASMFNRMSEGETISLLVISFVLTFLSAFYFLTTHEKFFRISGRFSDIEFSIKGLGQSGLNKFANRLSVESDNRKKEE